MTYLCNNRPNSKKHLDTFYPSKKGINRPKKTISSYCPFKVYSAESVDARMPGHLIPYPIQVEDDGSISELPGFALFPDTTAPVSGAKSTMLPMKLTT
jgi:phospholipase D1/2